MAVVALYWSLCAAVTVIVAVPADFHVTVPVVPLKLTVATPVALDAALSVPLQDPLDTVNVPVVVGYVIVAVVGLTLIEQVPRLTVNAYVLEPL